VADKRTAIINAAMALFSEKGFHATSMQEVADLCRVSKGTIYTYFSSKNELLYSIFDYYFESIKARMELAKRTDLPPKEKFTNLIDALIREGLKYKGFFKMMHRELMVAFRSDIHRLLIEMQMETNDWFRSMLIEVYGEEVRPCLHDAALILESIVNGYLRILMFEKELVNIDYIAGFITERMDDMIRAMIAKKPRTLLNEEAMERVRARYLGKKAPEKTAVRELLNDMKAVLKETDISREKREELEHSLEFIAQEIEKDEPKKFLIKGVLSNFDGLPEMNRYREEIARLLELNG